MIRMYGDLGNLDHRGRVILYAYELNKSEVAQLREGLRVLVWDGDYEAEGDLEYYEGHWRALIDPKTFIERQTGERLPKK